MKNSKYKNLLHHLSQIFKKDGYSFYVDGSAARSLYLGKPFDTITGWSDADLIYIATHFEGFLAGQPSPYSAAFNFGGREILISCSPHLIHSSRFSKAAYAAKRFELSADSLLYDPLADNFLDPLNKREALRSKLLQINEDSTITFNTVIKAALFESQGYTISSGMLKTLNTKTKKLLNTASKEVVRNGLSELLQCKAPSVALERLDELGLLCQIMPELEKLKGCPQDKDFHPEGDVFVHTVECFRHLKMPTLPLGLAMLLHDIGKPSTLALGKNIHFPEHSTVGARIAGKILRRLGYDKELIDEVLFYIRHHLVGHLFRRLPEDRLIELVMHPLFENLLRLYKADVLGSMAPLGEYRKVVKTALSIRNTHGMNGFRLKAAL